MIKSLIAANKSERDKFTIPRSVQQSIPIKCIYGDGTWQVGRKHSRTWRFTDVNYAAASEDDQRGIFLSYGGVLNSLPTDAAAKVTIINRRLNPVAFERTMLMKERGDGLDKYRREANAILTQRAAESNNLVQEKYITLSIPQRKIEESRAYFRRVDANLSKSFGRLESGARPVSNHDRLRILHDFFRPGEEQYFTFEQTAAIRRGLDFKDLICPDGMRFRAGHFEMGDKVGRVLFLKDYASYIKDSMISALSDFPRNLMLSIDILPIPTDEAVKEIQSRIMGIETDITRWQQRQNDKNNFTATVPYDLEQLRGEAKEFLSDLTERDQRMMFAVVTLVHIADSLEQLDADTDALMSIGREHLCQFSVLRYQQEDGLNTVLPYGLRRVKALRTLTTESTAVLMPFRVQEIQDAGGLSYGVNAISKNLLICDRKRLISPHAFYLGVSGSGKSMAMKSTIQNVALATGDDIIIIDAEREYGPLARALGGEVIEISPNSRHHINPLEVTEGYGDGENPIAMKSEIITSILEQQMGVGRLSGSHKSIIDRCTANVYQDYFNNRGRAPMPLLTDWRNEVMRQADPEAREIALAAELITEGSLNVFAHPGNVNMDSRIVVLDLYEMGEQLRPTALVVTLEAIQNRVMENRKRGKYTWVFLDEVYLYFKYHYSGEFLYRAWKRFRKYAGIMTAATQNVEECLKSETARLMLANSEFLLLFNQAATDRVELAKLLHISDTQMGYITNAEAGHEATDDTEAWTEKKLHITITPKSADDMRTAYLFSTDQNNTLTELLDELDVIGGLLANLGISDERVIEVLQRLPDDLPPERRAVVETACKLVGKVNYFWGGKSSAIGWDTRWGTLMKVTAPGNDTSGTYRPFGLDCSGFLDWVLKNVGLPSDGHWYIGRNLTAVSTANAKPGDFALYPDASHIGVVVGRNEAGKLLICHCASGQNNIVITEFSASGFTAVGKLSFMD